MEQQNQEQGLNIWQKLAALLDKTPDLGERCQTAGSLDGAFQLMQQYGVHMGISLGWTELAVLAEPDAGGGLPDEALEAISGGVGVADNLASLLQVLNEWRRIS